VIAHGDVVCIESAVPSKFCPVSVAQFVAVTPA
jgi:hypothetical protein